MSCRIREWTGLKRFQLTRHGVGYEERASAAS
jgi:hypothetical protein